MKGLRLNIDITQKELEVFKNRGIVNDESVVGTRYSATGANEQTSFNTDTDSHGIQCASVETTVKDNQLHEHVASGRTDINSGEHDNKGFLSDSFDVVLRETDDKTSNQNSDGHIFSKEHELSDGANEDNNAKRTLSCTDNIFRTKVVRTIFVLWNTIIMGWGYGQIGPTLPDLQIIAGVPLQQATWIFTGFAIGYLVGCLLAGLIQTRFNPHMLMFLYTLVSAITFALLPWIPIFIVMVIMRVIGGISFGGQDTGLHSMMFAIWGNEAGPVLQITHILFALGAILSPLVTKSFIRTISESLETSPMRFNTTQSTFPKNSTQSPITTDINHTPLADTNVHFAFLISGILLLSTAVPFLIMFIQKRHFREITRQSSSTSQTATKIQTMLPKRVERIVLCIMFVTFFTATACIDVFPNFLTTFVMEQINWTQQSASTLTAVYFAMYAVGNFIGIFVLSCTTSTKLIVVSYISTGITLICILQSVLFAQTELIWASFALSGVTMASILPILFTWTQEHVTPITPRLASCLLISGSLGVMVNPVVLGYMMELYSPMWFIYFSLGETVLGFVLFTSAVSLTRLYSNAWKTDRGVESRKESNDGNIEIYSIGT